MIDYRITVMPTGKDGAFCPADMYFIHIVAKSEQEALEQFTAAYAKDIEGPFQLDIRENLDPGYERSA